MAYLKWDAFVITEAANYTTKQVKQLIKEYREEYPIHEGLAKRTDKSYLNEWAVHALCYRWGIMRAKAKDAHLQFDMEPEVNLIYNILGPIARFFLLFYCKK